MKSHIRKRHCREELSEEVQVIFFTPAAGVEMQQHLVNSLLEVRHGYLKLSVTAIVSQSLP